MYGGECVWLAQHAGRGREREPRAEGVQSSGVREGVQSSGVRQAGRPAAGAGVSAAGRGPAGGVHRGGVHLPSLQQTQHLYSRHTRESFSEILHIKLIMLLHSFETEKKVLLHQIGTKPDFIHTKNMDVIRKL